MGSVNYFAHTNTTSHQFDDYGRFLTSEQWSKPAHQRRHTPITTEPVTVRNSAFSTSQINFANYFIKGSLQHKIVFMVDGHAQIFERHMPYNSAGDALGIDPIDPLEFNALATDLDDDGDDDIVLAYATQSRWNHEQIELMTFENDGTGHFARVGFDPDKPRWAIASAHCFNGLCLADAPQTANFFSVDLYQTGNDEQGRKKFDIGFRASDGSIVTNSISIVEGSTQMAPDSFRINDKSIDDLITEARELVEDFDALGSMQ